MKIKYFLFISFFFVFLSGCTTAGSKFININYSGKTVDAKNIDIGVSEFKDSRGENKKKYLGKRILNSGKEETYYVTGKDLSTSITEMFKSYLKNSGYNVFEIKTWEPSPEGIGKIDKKFRYIVAGNINEFEFFAAKGFTTTMSLDIEITIFRSNLETGIITTVPVKLNLKRKDLKFTTEKVEIFINESIKDVILRSMKF